MSKQPIEERTPCNPEVTRQMAVGAIAAAPEADLALAAIGVAGPKPDQGKLAGHVCIASCLRRELPIARELTFYGNPDAVLPATMLAAFDMGLATLAPDRNGRPDP